MDLTTTAKMRAFQGGLDRKMREQTEQEWEKISHSFQAQAELIDNIQKLSVSRAQELAAQVGQIRREMSENAQRQSTHLETVRSGMDTRVERYGKRSTT